MQKTSNKKNLKKIIIIITCIHLIWMLFFDSSDFITIANLYLKLRKYKAQKSYYEKNISKIKKYKNALLYDKKMLEKIAREKYYMVRPGEYIYLVR